MHFDHHAVPRREHPIHRKIDGADSGLTPPQFVEFCSEIRNHIAFCLRRPRQINSRMINLAARRALSKFCQEHKEPLWTPLPIMDHIRAPGRVFGQVNGVFQKHGFVAVWGVYQGESADNPTTVRKAAFKFIPHATITDITESALKGLTVAGREGILRMLLARPAQPCRHQVPLLRGNGELTSVGRWLTELYGNNGVDPLNNALGHFQGESALGVFSLEVLQTLNAHGYSHAFLPYSRRKPGTEPWHTGEYLCVQGESLIWEDWVLSKSRELAKVRIVITLEGTVNSIQK